ncbi:hypothetical protein [Actinopolyspora mortivallis]|uniref:Uncharacterized protein n=1 Tax=Actinopolyspora mortivallis TaxID=33906 RepID=A0A2T0GYQ1_ACTMO|nr:hypothetical protein [Actinopolyspora mortivallis]PRW64231.1 hypothetical protein CEP50_06240 [Actinopolyspora mortivallis]
MGQDGFTVDQDLIRQGLEELRQARDEARDLERQIQYLEPGELTAEDRNTRGAREVFQRRMTGDGSVRSAAAEIRLRLDERIRAYEEAVGEYARAEDNANAEQRGKES